ncbi:hypothetical protein Tco_0977877 [Tanacetum coccineum]|uniref:Uncharacterized protein n=1 Tax=Tanacetum coccineum TaxID=301880 RepID=A0ABQ5ELC8_9ASTR
MTLASSADKPLKIFDELMSTPIDFSAFIMNGMKINNLTQETLLGPAFRLLKGTRSNYAELEYDFEECYKALSEKLDWENPKSGDCPFDLTKPLPLVMSIKDMVPNIWVPGKVAYDKHALWGISHWREQRKSFYGYARGLQSRHDVYSTKRILAVTQVERKTRKDPGTRRGRHSTSSSSAFDQPSSSHLNDDDYGNGEGTSRASTPSPIRFVNSQTNDIP